MNEVEVRLPHLAQITHLSEELCIYIICSVRHHYLRALSCKRIDNVPAKKSCAAKDCCCDSADLHGGQKLKPSTRSAPHIAPLHNSHVGTHGL